MAHPALSALQRLAFRRSAPPAQAARKWAANSAGRWARLAGLAAPRDQGGAGFAWKFNALQFGIRLA